MALIISCLYLLSVAALLGWSIAGSKKRISNGLGALFFMSFICFTVFYFISSINGIMKIPYYLAALGILSVTAFLTQKTKKSLPLSVLIAVSSFLIVKSILIDKLFSSNAYLPETALLDDTWELLVELKTKNDLSDLDEIVSKYNLTVERAFHPESEGITELDDVYAIGIPDQHEIKLNDITKALSDMKDVVWVEENENYELTYPEPQSDVYAPQFRTTINDPLVAQQWSYDILNYEGLRNDVLPLLQPKKTALVAVLDSGIDAQHEDLKDNYKSIDRDSGTDANGHGTHCAGIVAAVSNNKIGISSINPGNQWVKVTAINVNSVMGMIPQKKALAAIIKAADNGADVISMSFGGRSFSSQQKLYADAVDYANQKGVILVAAAGNSTANASKYSPANVKNIIAVAAVNNKETRSYFSNTVEDIVLGISAPGEDVLSTFPGNKYESKSGTSMATPHVSGLLGLMKSIRPSLTTQEAYDILHSTGKELKESKKTGRLIQPVKAILATASM